MNLNVGFYCPLELTAAAGADRIIVRVAAASTYRLFINGRFVGCGPARAAHGWAYFLRLELLSRYGLHRQVLDETVTYFLPMAERTGTLWEHEDERASCNHGFASHLAFVLRRELAALAGMSSDTFR